ncbi:IMP-specific 5'-nucleotidase 1 [Nakaseomyces bracarensis]|uniref:IMP-specific 5'-nucleotidase 1 n=1 Tax=Nakaseomyces bracarensis TaxID=273131 RepID=A0ABR4NWU2_9SACH
MSSRYRVEYHLKSHRKDGFIDWIKGLLASPFVLHAVSHDGDDNDELTTTQRVRSQYAEIFKDIEALIADKIAFDVRNNQYRQYEDATNDEAAIPLGQPRLDLLVPTIGTFFTELPLEKAFLWEDSRRAISTRRMVAPSFNDIRRVLNSAQIFHFIKQRNLNSSEQLRMCTFDGDVTLYEDGGSIVNTNPVIPLMLTLLRSKICIGIVTAAGYDEATTYEKRLNGLITAVHESDLPYHLKRNLTVMGGESNYLFRYYEDGEKFGFEAIDKEEWLLPRMCTWSQSDLDDVLDFAEKTLHRLKKRLNLPEEAEIIRKARAVGIVPGHKIDPESGKLVKYQLDREQLEEVVLTLQNSLEGYRPAQRIQFSCFDGGSDVWCDIGGKDLGVRALQHYYDPSNPIKPSQTLHVGDQFAPVGSANDFKARLAGCTLWISSPKETVDYLRRLVDME